MANSIDSEQFLKTGYQILEAESLEPLHRLREEFFLKAKELVGYDGSNMEDFFDNFHRYELRGSSLNDVRMGLINHSTNDLDVPGAIFDAFAGPITARMVLSSRMPSLMMGSGGSELSFIISLNVRILPTFIVFLLLFFCFVI